MAEDTILLLLNGDSVWNWMPPANIQYNPAENTPVTELRALADCWIASGTDPSGREKPCSRNLSGIPPNTRRPLLDSVSEWLVQYPRRYELTLTGKQNVLTPPVPGLRNADRSQFAKDYAMYWFHQLLDAPHNAKFRLARCSNRKCRTYYFRQRAYKQEIKRGVYCGNCQATGSLERTRISRSRQKQALIDLAADAWPEGSQRTGRYPCFAHALMAAMSKRDETVCVTRNWVTRNKAEIESEVRRRKDARS